MRDEMQVIVTHENEGGESGESRIETVPPDVTVSGAPSRASKRMVLNPDRNVTDKIIDRIYKCGGKCPCQPGDSGVDTRCPCPDFTNEGICHCKLFIPVEE